LSASCTVQVHCDVKPDNFCVDNKRSTRVLVFDLGPHACSCCVPAMAYLKYAESCMHHNPAGGAMRMPDAPDEANEEVEFFGTPNYASLTGLQCLRCSPRDDLESLCYRCGMSLFTCTDLVDLHAPQ